MTGDTSENRRAESARANDDSDIIEAAEVEAAPGQQGSSGGDLQRDIATDAELQQVEDPEAHRGKTKGKAMAHGDFSPAPGSADSVVGERKN